jgi:multimeric flavodoxin WrbA
MKVLILNDCVSKNTETFVLLKGICDEIEVPYEIEWANIHDLDMQPCKKCLKCQPCGECILPEDDAHKIGRKIFVADALVVGLESSPQSVSVPFEMLLDRCTSSIAFRDRQGKTCPWRKGRTAVIASSGETANMTRTPTRRADIRRYPLLRTLDAGGFKLISNVGERPKKVFQRKSCRVCKPGLWETTCFAIC